MIVYLTKTFLNPRIYEISQRPVKIDFFWVFFFYPKLGRVVWVKFYNEYKFTQCELDKTI